MKWPVLLLAACGGGGAAEPRTCDSEPVHTGEATYYDFADGSGNCSFPPSPEDLMVAAMNTADYAGSATCGACAHVSGPEGEVTVRIVDRCPGCAAGDLDLSPQAFEAISPLAAGRVAIAWELVPCPVAGPLAYHLKDGSSQWWVAIQVRNHRHPILSLEALVDGQYLSLPRAEYNYFIAEAGLGVGPFTLRVTDIYGHQVEDSSIPLGDDTVAQGVGQLESCP
jgi:expansin (peptidoglycan-binding protein)